MPRNFVFFKPVKCNQIFFFRLLTDLPRILKVQFRKRLVRVTYQTFICSKFEKSKIFSSEFHFHVFFKVDLNIEIIFGTFLWVYRIFKKFWNVHYFPVWFTPYLGSISGQHFQDLVNAIHAPYVPYLLQYGRLEKEYLLQEVSCTQMVKFKSSISYLVWKKPSHLKKSDCLFCYSYFWNSYKPLILNANFLIKILLCKIKIFTDLFVSMFRSKNCTFLFVCYIVSVILPLIKILLHFDFFF